MEIIQQFGTILAYRPFNEAGNILSVNAYKGISYPTIRRIYVGPFISGQPVPNAATCHSGAGDRSHHGLPQRQDS